MKSRLLQITAWSMIGWFLAVGIITAVVWTVDDDDPAADFSSVQAAINAASAGDVVQVACGTYNENIQIKNGVSVIGADPRCVILDGGAAGSVVTFVDIRENIGLGIPPTEFSRFTIRNGRSIQGGGIFLDNSTPILTRHLITGNQAVQDAVGGYGFGGGISAYYSAPMISNTLIIGNTAEKSGGGMDLYFSYPLVSNSTIVGNTATAPPSGGSGYGGGVYALNSDPELHSNVIINNTSDAGGGGVDLINSSFTTIDYCDTFGNSLPNISGTFQGNVGNISVDPWLVSMSPLALCPRSDSPVLDTGDPGGTFTLTDYYGRPRIMDGDLDGIAGNGTRLDIGACEGGDSTLLMVDAGSSFSWDPGFGRSIVYNLYRSVLSAFLSSCSTTCVYTQNPAVVPGAAQQCDLATPLFADGAAPPLGDAFIYWATGENALEGPIGFAMNGAVLPNDNPCP
jgi:hypothetical protein